MLRSDNSPDATNVMIALTRSNGVQFNRRWFKGNYAGHSGDMWGSAPDTVWLRLIKRTESIEFFTARDKAGEYWTSRATR